MRSKDSPLPDPLQVVHLYNPFAYSISANRSLAVSLMARINSVARPALSISVAAPIFSARAFVSSSFQIEIASKREPIKPVRPEARRGGELPALLVSAVGGLYRVEL